MIFTDPAIDQWIDEVGLLAEDTGGCLLYVRQKIGIANDIRDLHLHQPRLSSAKDLTRASQLKIAPGNFETVVSLAQYSDPFASLLRHRGPVQQDTTRLLGTATDTTA